MAICLPRSVEAVIGQYAVWKCGGAYLPIDSDHPTDRIGYMLADSAAQAVVTTKELAASHGISRAVCVDTDWPDIDRLPGELTACEPAAHDRAYVIYTSGSTGRPKGVEVAHASLMNLVTWHLQEYAITAEDRSTLVASPGFDAAVWELWPYLVAGASVHIPDDEVRYLPEKLAPWLVDEQITIAFVPTPTAESLLDEPCLQGAKLRHLLTGGDRLTRRGPEDSSFQLVNHYGPTENTVVATATRVQSRDQRASVPAIGRPIGNNFAYVLDRHLAIVPEGTPGELYLAGQSLALGYLNRADLTAERFVPCPFADGQRMYKTGDLVRWLPHGTLDYLGRVDQQVKVRGVRIELGEIESLLSSLTGVKQSVVAAFSSVEGNQLAAYVVPEDDVDLSVAELREQLRRLLPEVMVPATLTLVDALPLTRHGKVDRQALPRPDHDSQRSAVQYVAPRSESEQRIADIWARLLGLSQVGVLDRFLDVGGNSLSAVRMLAELQEAFGVSVPLRILFDEGTVERLATVVEQEQSRPVPLPLVQLQPGAEKAPLFVVHPAEGTIASYIRLVEQLPGDQGVYGLQAPGLEGEALPLLSVEEMAIRYVASIRTLQAHGPYYLAGWSFGGLVAYEMARRLQHLGEPVALLALLDSYVVSRYAGAEDDVLDGRVVANGIQYYLAQLGLSLPMAVDELTALEPLDQIQRVVGQSREQGVQLPDDILDQAENLLTLWRINGRAAQRYEPTGYAGRVTLFVAEQKDGINPAAVTDQVAAWRGQANLSRTSFTFRHHTNHYC